jgi:hypothetical protein
MYAHVRELQRRDLVQRRRVWGAVLPHAVANRIAAEVLENIPAADVQAGLITKRTGAGSAILFPAAGLFACQSESAKDRSGMA